MEARRPTANSCGSPIHSDVFWGILALAKLSDNFDVLLREFQFNKFILHKGIKLNKSIPMAMDVRADESRKMINDGLECWTGQSNFIFIYVFVR